MSLQSVRRSARNSVCSSLESFVRKPIPHAKRVGGFGGFYESSLFLRANFNCDNMIAEEDNEIKVRCSIFKSYLTICGGKGPLIFLMLCHAAVAVVNLLAADWIRQWVQ